MCSTSSKAIFGKGFHLSHSARSATDFCFPFHFSEFSCGAWQTPICRVEHLHCSIQFTWELPSPGNCVLIRTNTYTSFSVALCWHCGSSLVQKCCTLCPEQVVSEKGCGVKWEIYLQVFKKELLSVFFTVLQPALKWLEIRFFTFSYSWRENSTRRMHL